MSDKPTREYIVVISSAWMNQNGFGVSYAWDGKRFATRPEAIAEGFKIRQSDDFNIAVLRGDWLVSFDWMNAPVGEDDAAMQEIADALSLHFRSTATPEPPHGR